MSNYRRLRVPGGCYFLTINLQDRNADLLVRHIAQLRSAIRQVRRARPFNIEAWVVLPEHMHCMIVLPQGDDGFSERVRDIKANFSRALPNPGPNVAIRRSSQSRRRERSIWQRRFWEHWIRSNEDWSRHFDYIHFNPVKHGHVTHARDWPYSTFHHWVKQGMYPRDWGRCNDGDLAAGER